MKHSVIVGVTEVSVTMTLEEARELYDILGKLTPEYMSRSIGRELKRFSGGVLYGKANVVEVLYNTLTPVVDNA